MEACDKWHAAAIRAESNAIYINDIVENIVSMVSEFVNITKNCAVEDSDGCLSLQQDLNQLGKCDKEWQMEFSFDKYKLLHFGKLNQSRICRVNDRPLKSVAEYRDLEVQVHNSQKMAIHIDICQALNTRVRISYNSCTRDWLDGI